MSEYTDKDGRVLCDGPPHAEWCLERRPKGSRGHRDPPTGVKHGDPDVSCVISTTKTDTIGGQVVPWCETHNYPCSPTLMLCLFGAGEAERKRRRVLHCPYCKAQHIDKGKWATFAHPKHRCEHCSQFFEDPLGPSIGVATPGGQ